MCGTPARRESKMKKFALIALIMVLGLSGCAYSGVKNVAKEDWNDYWSGPRSESWTLIKQDWNEFWN
jgi:hypothetical protein